MRDRNSLGGRIAALVCYLCDNGMDENRSINKVTEILRQGSDFQIKSIDDLNRGIKHILQLVGDSYILYVNGSFASSLFMSITIIEEVAKVHLGMFTKDPDTASKKDPLRKEHAAKHIAGANYTISMGTRLVEAIGKDEMERIFQVAYDGNMKNLRERALYCECEHGKIRTPQERITKKQARAMLLFAIESFDDNLVGYTDYSMEKSKWTDELFERVAKEQ